MMKNFYLVRDEDESGVSGTGYVAEGVQFTSGEVVISWLTHTSSVCMYHSMEDMERIHGHGGKTRVEWAQDQQ